MQLSKQELQTQFSPIEYQRWKEDSKTLKMLWSISDLKKKKLLPPNIKEIWNTMKETKNNGDRRIERIPF